MRSLGGAAMGFGAGGEIAQRIYPDPHGRDTWDEENPDVTEIHVLNSLEFELATGIEAPPTPIDAQEYSKRHLPWFTLYDEEFGDLAESALLAGVTTLAEHDALRQSSPDGSTRRALAEQSLDVIPIRLSGAPKTPRKITKGE